jgi:hypothetical protein
MTAEACSLVSGNTYRITDIARRIIDPETAYTVYENGVPTAQSIVVDHLQGTITFAGAATTPVTITGKFIPRGRLLCAREAELTEETASLDKTCFKLSGETDAGVRLRRRGIIDASGTVSHIDLLTNQIDTSGTGAGVDATLVDALLRNALPYTILEIQFGTSQVWRGFIIFTSVSKSASIDDLVNETLSWELASTSVGYYSDFAYVA